MAPGAAAHTGRDGATAPESLLFAKVADGANQPAWFVDHCSLAPPGTEQAGIRCPPLNQPR